MIELLALLTVLAIKLAPFAFVMFFGFCLGIGHAQRRDKKHDD